MKRKSESKISLNKAKPRYVTLQTSLREVEHSRELDDGKIVNNFESVLKTSSDFVLWLPGCKQF